MKHAALMVAVLFGSLSASSQDRDKHPEKDKKTQEKMTPQKPQKEHDLLKQFEGDWDVTSKHYAPAMEESRGTETARMKLGGFWLVFDYKGEHDKQAYEGHGLMGYDPRKAMYVGVWTDSWSATLIRFEGKADSAGKVLTMMCDGVDPRTGQPATHKMVFEITDKDHWVLRFYAPEKEGKETVMGEMVYTRSGKK